MAIRRWWWREEKKYCRFDFCVCPVKICVTLYNTQRENDITPTRRNEAHILSTEPNRRESRKKVIEGKKKIVSYHLYCDLTSSSVCVCERMWSSPCEWRSFLSLYNCYLRLCNLFFKPLLIIFCVPSLSSSSLLPFGALFYGILNLIYDNLVESCAYRRGFFSYRRKSRRKGSNKKNNLQSQQWRINKKQKTEMS